MVESLKISKNGFATFVYIGPKNNVDTSMGTILSNAATGSDAYASAIGSSGITSNNGGPKLVAKAIHVSNPCSVCLNDILDSSDRISMCLDHWLCILCFQSYIDIELASKRIPIKCAALVSKSTATDKATTDSKTAVAIKRCSKVIPYEQLKSKMTSASWELHEKIILEIHQNPKTKLTPDDFQAAQHANAETSIQLCPACLAPGVKIEGCSKMSCSQCHLRYRYNSQCNWGCCKYAHYGCYLKACWSTGCSGCDCECDCSSSISRWLYSWISCWCLTS